MAIITVPQGLVLLFTNKVHVVTPVSVQGITVAEYIASKLADLGVRVVFGYPGANITYVIDAIASNADLNYVQNYHEQGAAFAANGYAQSSGLLGVAVSSSGPGALNLTTGVANAFFDSVPTIFICGDLSRKYKKPFMGQRQEGFQHTDVVSLFKTITKYSVQVERAEDIKYIFEKAIYEATSGRKGPVLISIPHFIQRTVVHLASMKSFFVDKVDYKSTINNYIDFKKIANFVLRSRRPLILIGGGASNSIVRYKLKLFLDDINLPVVSSLCGLDGIDHENVLYVGFIGDYGHRHANIALAASDCLIVLGSRLDERQISFIKDFKEKKIFHVDIDPGELWAHSENYFPIKCDIESFLNNLKMEFEKFNLSDDWLMALKALKEKHPIHCYSSKFSVSSFFSCFSPRLSKNAQIFVDVGLHQMCTAQFLALQDGQRLFFSAGLGSMGYAVPASVGGLYANTKHQTICIVGDGGLMMSLSELQTIGRDQIPIKIFVFNNHSLGMIREHQVKSLNSRTVGSIDGYLAGDLNKLAFSFGLDFYRIISSRDCELVDDILDSPKPVLIEVLFEEEMMPFPSSVDYLLDDEILNYNKKNGVCNV